MAYENLTRAIIGAESSGDPYARNSRSSAGGLGQFIDSTWLNMVRKHRPDIAQGKTDQQLLQLKYDPALSAEMTRAYASDNANYLKSRGVAPDDTALSLSHFAGPGGAVNVYSDPNKTVQELLGPRAVAANPFMRNMTGRDLINWAGKRVGSKTPEQSMAQSTINRYGGERGIPKQQVGATNTDLQSALKSSYDPRKLSQAQGLIRSGQELADTKNPNWLSALGATALAGYGGYLEDKQAAEQKKSEATINEEIQGAGNLSELAKALMRSPDKAKQNAGINLLAKALTPAKSTATDHMREYTFAMQQRKAAGKEEVPFTQWMRENKGDGSATKFARIGTNAMGEPVYGFVKPDTGEVTPYTNKGAEQQTEASTEGLRGEELLKVLPTQTANQIKALSEGRMQVPSGFALKHPYWQRMISLLSQYDPAFDMSDYRSRYNTRKDFTSGKSAQNITSFNTAIGHLKSLDDNIDKLGNTSVPAYNAMYNRTRKQYDTDYQKALNSFRTSVNAVAAELTRAFRGTGGTLEEIKDWKEAINEADSPEALHASVRQGVDLLRSRIEAVGDQYNRGMKTSKDPIQLLSPRAREAIKMLEGTGTEDTQNKATNGVLKYNPATGDFE